METNASPAIILLPGLVGIVAKGGAGCDDSVSRQTAERAGREDGPAISDLLRLDHSRRALNHRAGLLGHPLLRDHRLLQANGSGPRLVALADDRRLLALAPDRGRGGRAGRAAARSPRAALDHDGGLDRRGAARARLVARRFADRLLPDLGRDWPRRGNGAVRARLRRGRELVRASASPEPPSPTRRPSRSGYCPPTSTTPASP